MGTSTQTSSLQMLLSGLQAPFAVSVIRQRPLVIRRDKSAAIPANYIDARAVMDRLDQVLGPFNWQSDFKEIKGIAYAGLGIRNPETGEWIWKWDAGRETDVEKAKGEASDGFKRAAVKFGIGRDLYAIPDKWVNGYRAQDGRFRFQEEALETYRQWLTTWMVAYQRSQSPADSADSQKSSSDGRSERAQALHLLKTDYFQRDRTRWTQLLEQTATPADLEQFIETLRGEKNRREQAAQEFMHRLENAKASFHHLGLDDMFQSQLREVFASTRLDQIAKSSWDQADIFLESLLALYEQQKEAA